MAGELVFVTGASGFVGAQVINEALKAGYRVRGTVRRDSAAKQLQEYFGPEYGDKFESVIVTDITVPESFDGLFDEVSYIIHVASPMPSKSTEWQKDFIDPAVNGTLAVLEAAIKVPSIKRVVITASIVSLTPLSGTPEGVVLKEENAKGVSVDPNFTFTTSFEAYHASKLLADQASTRFLETRNPHFSLITIHPSFIFGRNLLQRSIQELGGTNGLLWMSLTSAQPVAKPWGVHVVDVAEAHVKALTVHVPSGSKFLVTAPAFSWNEVVEFIKEKYPKMPVKLEQQPEKEWLIDTTRAEKELGMKWRGWKEFVGDVVEQQLEFLDKA